MAGRVKPCPKFPRSFKDEPYRAWRMALVHWVWQMRTACICESLLGAPLLEALKEGASGVWEAAVMLDPRILRSAGRPANGNYWGDPGELSGTVWYVEAVLDEEFLRKEYEYGRTARESYYKIRRNGTTSQDVISRQDRAYALAGVLGDFKLSNTARTDQLFLAVGLDGPQKANVLLQVRGDESRYHEIKQIIKDIYPFHSDKEVKLVALADAAA